MFQTPKQSLQFTQNKKWTENTCMLVLVIHKMVYLECSLLRAQNAKAKSHTDSAPWAELAVSVQTPVCGCGPLEQ